MKPGQIQVILELTFISKVFCKEKEGWPTFFLEGGGVKIKILTPTPHPIV